MAVRVAPLEYDAVTTVPAGSKTSPGRYVILSGGVVMAMLSSLMPPPAPPTMLNTILRLHSKDIYHKVRFGCLRTHKDHLSVCAHILCPHNSCGISHI